MQPTTTLRKLFCVRGVCQVIEKIILDLHQFSSSIGDSFLSVSVRKDMPICAAIVDLMSKS
jgi:hypothetical protein